MRDRISAQTKVAGGLLVAFLVGVAALVVWVSNDAKQPLVQPHQSTVGTTSAAPPTPTVAAEPIPSPASTPSQTPVIETSAPPVQAMPTASVTAETMAPPPPHRLPRLRDLFPRLFPSG